MIWRSALLIAAALFLQPSGLEFPSIRKPASVTVTDPDLEARSEVRFRREEIFVDGIPAKQLEGEGLHLGATHAVYVFERNGAWRLIKILNTSLEEAQAEVEMAKSAREATHEGPQVHRAGMFKSWDDRERPFIEMDFALPDRPTITLKSISLQAEADPEKDVELWGLLRTKDATGDSPVARIARYLVHCLEQGILPIDADFVISKDLEKPGVVPIDFGRYQPITSRWDAATPVMEFFSGRGMSYLFAQLKRTPQGVETARELFEEFLHELSQPSQTRTPVARPVILEAFADAIAATNQETEPAFRKFERIDSRFHSRNRDGVMEAIRHIQRARRLGR
jgi:hypothetical protein